MNMRILLCALVLAAAASPAFAQRDMLRLKHDAANSELIFTIGPVDLPTGEHHAHGEQPGTQAVTLPFSGYLQSYTAEMYDDAGRRLPDALLHHVNIMAPERRELFSQIMQRVGAAGAETGPMHLPRLLGYPVQRGDSLLFTVMFHNPTATPYQNAELRIRMKYSTAGSLLPKVAIQPFYLDVMPPAGYHVYTLPPGKSSKSWEGSPAVPGRILGLGGHMHKYGVLLRFEDVTKGRVIWEAQPIVDADGNVTAMPRKLYLWKLGQQIKPTHVYRLTAVYDNPTGAPIEGGGMGALGGFFVADERAVWPAVDREHPDYLADLEVMFPERRGSAAPQQHRH
jgi:hypothetical protein